MNGLGERQHELPGKVERILAAVAASCQRKGRKDIQSLLVNARYEVDEGWSYDNWDGGQWGHRLRLIVPPAIFYEIMEVMGEMESEICEVANKIQRVPHEHFDSVAVEIAETPEHSRWREDSGLLMDGATPSAGMLADADRIWGEGWFRVFLSHVSAFKKDAADLKTELGGFGIASFVAHEDIEPTKEWQGEIEVALRTMDACIALLTPGFHESRWTDQELGFAMGRAVPVIPVRLGVDPYGFFGRLQAVSPKSQNAKGKAGEIFRVLLQNPRLHDRVVRAFVKRFIEARGYEEANMLVRYLEKLDSLPPDLLVEVEEAASRNPQLRDAYGVNNRLPGALRRLKQGKEE